MPRGAAGKWTDHYWPGLPQRLDLSAPHLEHDKPFDMHHVSHERRPPLADRWVIAVVPR